MRDKTCIHLMNKYFITRKELARRIGISGKTVRRALDSSRGHSHAMGVTRMRIEAELENIIDECEMQQAYIEKVLLSQLRIDLDMKNKRLITNAALLFERRLQKP